MYAYCVYVAANVCCQYYIASNYANIYIHIHIHTYICITYLLVHTHGKLVLIKVKFRRLHLRANNNKMQKKTNNNKITERQHDYYKNMTLQKKKNKEIEIVCKAT